MTTINVNNSAPFGQMSNTVVRNIYFVDGYMKRLNAAVANGAAGFGGTAGTEYEVNPFGVTPSGTPGDQGAAWAYAMTNLATAWATFMSAAQASLNALDNGSN
jgi:hypothetical protein